MKNLMLILMMFLLGTSYAQETDIGVHDPVMIKEGDTYYLFCTGWGISVWSSKDMKSWKKSTFEKIWGTRKSEKTLDIRKIRRRGGSWNSRFL